MFQLITNYRAALAARLHEEDGATAVEYGLMVALIAVVIIAAVVALGGMLQNSFAETCRELNGAVTNNSITCPDNETNASSTS